MSYFPILSAPGCTGETYLHNFPPNDWESFHPRAKIVNLTWASGNQWYSKPIGRIAFGESLLVAQPKDLRVATDAQGPPTTVS